MLAFWNKLKEIRRSHFQCIVCPSRHHFLAVVELVELNLINRSDSLIKTVKSCAPFRHLICRIAKHFVRYVSKIATFNLFILCNGFGVPMRSIQEWPHSKSPQGNLTSRGTFKLVHESIMISYFSISRWKTCNDKQVNVFIFFSKIQWSCHLF